MQRFGRGPGSGSHDSDIDRDRRRLGLSIWANGRYHAPVNVSTNRVDWLVFLALGFMWGSSYLFIKLAVDDFGTFTLVALRLLVGATLLWIVIKLAKQPLPRERRMYGHLLVMAIVNITIPFLLITWAEQSVHS